MRAQHNTNLDMATIEQARRDYNAGLWRKREVAERPHLWPASPNKEVQVDAGRKA